MIKNKYSFNKINYEENGQQSFFGRDNLFFKTVNMPKKQRFDNISKDFQLKKIIQNISLSLSIFEIK